MLRKLRRGSWLDALQECRSTTGGVLWTINSHEEFWHINLLFGTDVVAQSKNLTYLRTEMIWYTAITFIGLQYSTILVSKLKMTPQEVDNHA